MIQRGQTHASAGMRYRARLIVVLGLTASFMIVEAVVGFLTDSLILIADAGHMLTTSRGFRWRCWRSGSRRGRRSDEAWNG